MYIQLYSITYRALDDMGTKDCTFEEHTGV